MKDKIYFAAPLFSKADQMFNEYLVKKIREELSNFEFDVYLPQENMAINDKNSYANSSQILSGDLKELDESKILVAMIDGSEVDAGVAAEIGYSYAKGKIIVALFTDSRQQGYDNIKKINALSEVGENQFMYKNLFVTGMVKEKGHLLTNVEDLIDILSFYLKPKETSDTKDDKARVYYTDGSYRPSVTVGYAGWGFFTDGFEGSGYIEQTMRNIDGEIQAAIMAVEHAKSISENNIVIVHDYEGVGKWPDEVWEAKAEGTIKYKTFIQREREEGMSISFQWVRGHEGNYGNEIADELARKGLDLLKK